MAFSDMDRTKEVESNVEVILINSTDHCHYYRKHPDTFLQRRECWTCIYSEFGINSGNSSDKGVCEYGKNRIKHKISTDKLRKELKL